MSNDTYGRGLYVAVGISYLDLPVTGNLVGQRANDDLGIEYKWTGRAGDTLESWEAVARNGKSLVEITDPRGAFPEDQYLEVTHALTFGQTLTINGLSGYKLGIFLVSDLTGDATSVGVKGVINGTATALLAGIPVNGGADTTTFSTVGYRVDLGYPSIQIIANGTSGGLNCKAIYMKTGSTAYVST